MRGATKTVGTSHAIYTTEVQRIQCGTNCPLGNRRKTSTNKLRARKIRHSFGTRQREGLADTAFVAMIGPRVTSKSATKSAMRSSGLRQTINVLTTRHTTAEASVSAIIYAA